jgi:hypothetical protein
MDFYYALFHAASGRNGLRRIFKFCTQIKGPMKHSLYILTILTLASTSCKPLSEIGNKNVQAENVTKENFRKLNGTYANNFDSMTGKINHSPGDGLSSHERLTILSQLFKHLPETAWRDKNNKLIDPKEKWIRIEFQSKKLSTISMYHNDNFVFSKKIHGKFKNGYFYLRPKIFVIPFVPLAFGYNFERARIGISDGNLIIDYRINRWGFAILAGSSDKGYSSSVYKKKK